LRAGVDINTIRAWLGHVSIDTTNVYAEVDLETKAKMLAACGSFTAGKAPARRWRGRPVPDAVPPQPVRSSSHVTERAVTATGTRILDGLVSGPCVNRHFRNRVS
jgi:hypothetical protein